MVLISVIMPVYNPDDKQFNDALNSILGQSYKNFELIIINDGSYSGYDFESLRKLDPRIRLYNLKKNIGISNCLNLGIRESRGSIIARMDSDDVAFEKRFEIQLKYLNKYSILSSNVILIDRNDHRVGKSRFLPFHNLVRRFQLYILHKNPVNHPTIMAKKEIFEQFSYDSMYDGAEDFELWLRMKTKYKIYFDSNYVLYYRISLNQENPLRIKLHKEISKKYRV